ncbi:hypothetical protein [Tsukamurella pseudospumae]|uniref:DUF2442 domain-containing protein n=1 Tax=Tsukamurella pseudospumae TaxID=239498 RepID=A0A138AEB3_9ACTN|nr:hypothetical protein [Tsukamurella pseudospumae]KXP08792.1 hypothetical protein AXK60_09000 [Tsukamurella pseudospumae]
MAVPWPITAVECRGGTVVRIWHADGTVADHDFRYLLGRDGVFAALTAEMTPRAQLVDGTVGWILPDGTVIDLAPDALHAHAVIGQCPGGMCRGWTAEHTVLVRRAE